MNEIYMWNIDFTPSILETNFKMLRNERLTSTKWCRAIHEMPPLTEI